MLSMLWELETMSALGFWEQHWQWHCLSKLVSILILNINSKNAKKVLLDPLKKSLLSGRYGLAQTDAGNSIRQSRSVKMISPTSGKVCDVAGAAAAALQQPLRGRGQPAHADLCMPSFHKLQQACSISPLHITF